jgi:transketolase
VEKKGPSLKERAEEVVDAYGQALVKLAKKRKDMIVLDADLSADCGLRPFEHEFPERFIECGIAEQDMASCAGGLALQGYLPIVNSFASFLASRSNEQIYTNSCEGSKIIYVCHYAGVIPAGPGLSHQSLRDISLLSTLPDMPYIIQPSNPKETQMALDYCVNEAEKTCVLRLVIGPSPRRIYLPLQYRFKPGCGCVLKDGKDAAIVSYGPVMLHEALLASEILEKEGFKLKVINMPWLNNLSGKWLNRVFSGINRIYIVDDHSSIGGLGDRLIDVCKEKKDIVKLGVDGFAACGRPDEVLRYHGLDGTSLARHILKDR